MKKVFHYKYLLTLLLFSVLITISFYATRTMFMHFQVGAKSNYDIFAPQTVTYVDEDETKKHKKEVLSEVEAVYELKPEIQTEQTDKLTTFLRSVLDAKKQKIDDIAEMNLEAQNVNNKTVVQDVSNEKYLKAINNTYGYTDKDLVVFFNANEDELTKVSDVFSKEIQNFYSTGITTEKMDEQKNDFLNNSVFYHYDANIRKLLLDKITSLFVPNLVLNKDETDKKIAEVEKTLTPISRTIQRGEIIVRVGEVITNEHYAALKAAGVISDDFDWTEMVKRFPFVLLVLLSLHLFLYAFSNKEIQNKRLYIFAYTVALIAVFTTNFFQNQYFTYTILVMSIIAITTFLSPSVSILYAMVLGMLIHTGDYKFLVMATILGIVQALGHNPTGDRHAFLYLGFIMSGILVITNFVGGLVMGTAMTLNEFYPVALGPIIASTFVLGLFPFLESSLGLVTSLKLHELSTTKHKLVKRLINEAPGTFHHSLRVGNLAEAGADAIGANGLLLKVGALFHDVGKLENPLYFIENNTPETNPHNHLSPKESAAYIRQHPIDSVKLCRKYNVPEQIIELIEKHHGDGLIEYFYRKEKETNPDCDIADFKYTTPPPVTKEEGILLLADITEAFSRTILHEPKEVIKEKISDLIYEKVEEGLLRQCELTMREIGIVIDEFVNHLVPSNHKRIAYPEKKKNEH